MNLFPTHPCATELDDQEKISWLRLIRTENVGPMTFFQLLDTYGSATRALEALPGLSRKGGRLKDLRITSKDSVLSEIDRLESLGGRFVYATETAYPVSLTAIDDAPPVLSVMGNAKLLNLPAIGMVGARNASLNGCKFAEKLARELGEAGQIIASGLARGIDTAAHKGSLATGTVAVVAGGADIIYPPENTKLYEQIKFEGCIVAESPLGMEPMARHFPKRNRIISGLSSGTVVVEATLKSGSLITARMAAEQGRDVYAVPGHPFDPRAAGPNKLIQEGAILIQNAQDVLHHVLGFTGRRPALSETDQGPWITPDLSENDMEEVRGIILQNMSMSPVTVDELVRNCQLTIPAVQMALLELELAGRLQRLPGNRIVLSN